MTKPKKSKVRRLKGYPLDPRTIDDDTWFYEDGRGLLMVRWLDIPLHSGRHAESFYVPWRLIEAAVAVHRKMKASRAKKP